jgi:uroporphyrin-III C-methyltransferase
MKDLLKKPDLFVLGAGPGDPELITIKGFKILQKARVILYDNLANRELLEICPENCEKIYVGKQPYGEYTPQDTIHSLIKQYAYSHGEVVRLKGGDPFIFGRGFEEISFARENGINAYYIPGITSMQASGMEDIPLTHRELSEGIWALTGTKKNGSISEDLNLAMKSNSTIVIYMGMKQLSIIAQTYIQADKGNTPAAIIQHASLPHQKSIRGKVEELVEMAKNHNLTYPALIIIGPVVQISRPG